MQNSSPRPKKVFITGGLGYVGGRCSRFLAQNGLEILVGSRKASDIVRPDWLTSGKVVAYSTEMPSTDIAKILDGVDVIVHMASPNEIKSGQDPELAIHQNMIGTYRLCEAAKIAGVRQFIFFSTAHVYSSPLQGVCREDSLPMPKHPYAYSHLSAEYVLRSFSGSNGIPSCIVLRLTNSFGAPERIDVDRWTLIANDLCRQAAQVGELTLLTDGTGLRDFISLSDVERALLHLMKLDNLSEYEVFNLGSGKSVQIIEIAKLVAIAAKRIMGREIVIKTAPFKAGSNLQHLEIKVEKLKLSGFVWLNNELSEIQDTLSMCLNSSIGS